MPLQRTLSLRPDEGVQGPFGGYLIFFQLIKMGRRDDSLDLNRPF